MAGIFRELIIKPFLIERDHNGQRKPSRASGWEHIRALKIKQVGHCENCGKRYGFMRRWRLQVHHIKPYHLYPELELDIDNLMCLCSSPRCHLGAGHVGDWRAWNPEVRADCAYWLQKYRNRNYTRLCE